MIESLVSDLGPLGEALDWVDSRYGRIRHLEGRLGRPPEPRWWVWAAALGRCPAGSLDPDTETSAAGASLDAADALRRTLGEAVERYCGLHPPAPERLFPMALGDGPLAGSFPRCAADEPVPEFLRTPDPATRLTHTRVRRLSDDAAVAIPAGYVYQACPRSPGEPVPADGISTGLAFHSDPVRAIWGGLCEVAERDALMITWWARRPVRRIDTRVAPLPDELSHRLALLREVGLEADLFDISTDFRVPTVFCRVRSDRFPYSVCGASCEADPLRACIKAVDETLAVRHFLRHAEPLGEPDKVAPERIRSLADHAVLYGSWPDAPGWSFLPGGGEPDLPFDELASQDWWIAPTGFEDLRGLAARLEDQDLTVLWADVTTPDARALGTAVRVVVPQMLPLSPDHRVRWLATPRLLASAGVTDARCEMFHDSPHPFA